MALQMRFVMHASQNGGSEATFEDILKWCKEVGVLETHLCFSAVVTAFAKTLGVDDMQRFVADLAVPYGMDQSLDSKEAALEELAKRLTGNTQETETEVLDLGTEYRPGKRETEVSDLGTEYHPGKRSKGISRWICVKDLPYDCTLLDIMVQLTKYGEIVYASKDSANMQVKIEIDGLQSEEELNQLYHTGVQIRGKFMEIEPCTKQMKETSEDQDRFSLTLHVSNYNKQKATVSGLKKLFSLYGHITKIFSQKGTSVCWIEFEAAEQAANAAFMLHGVQLWGMILKVKVSGTDSVMPIEEEVDLTFFKSNSASLSAVTPSASVIVRNIPDDITEEYMIMLFNIRGTTKMSKFFKNSNGIRAAKLTFLSVGEAIEAIMVFDGKGFNNSDRSLEIEFR